MNKYRDQSPSRESLGNFVISVDHEYPITASNRQMLDHVSSTRSNELGPYDIIPFLICQCFYNCRIVDVIE